MLLCYNLWYILGQALSFESLPLTYLSLFPHLDIPHSPSPNGILMEVALQEWTDSCRIAMFCNEDILFVNTSYQSTYLAVWYLPTQFYKVQHLHVTHPLQFLMFVDIPSDLPSSSFWEQQRECTDQWKLTECFQRSLALGGQFWHPQLLQPQGPALWSPVRHRWIGHRKAFETWPRGISNYCVTFSP